MQLNRWNILIILVIALGLGVEVMKKSSKMPTTSEEAEIRAALNHVDDEIYARTDGADTANNGRAVPQAKVAQNSYKFPENHSFNENTPPAAPRGVMKYDKNAADKEKEKEKKKKKKKAKKEETKKPQTETVETKKPRKEDSFVQTPAAPAQPVLPKVGPAGPTSYEEWAQKILNQPDPKAVQEFIEAYQSGKISADVFYQIVREMIADSRQDMRDLGVFAAGRTPGYSSFMILATLIATEPANSEVHSRADRELNTYSQMGYLAVLESVIRSSSSNAAIVQSATDRINTAAQTARKQWLAHLAKNPPPTTTPNPTTQSTKNPYVRYFARFVDILQRLSTGSSSASTSAKQALDSINQLLQS